MDKQNMDKRDKSSSRVIDACPVLVNIKGFWNAYRTTTAEVPTRGNLVPDAHLAALLRQHGVKTLYTHDRDFLKFSFLDVRDPLS